jgi:hypothetical protein
MSTTIVIVGLLYNRTILVTNLSKERTTYDKLGKQSTTVQSHYHHTFVVRSTMLHCMFFGQAIFEYNFGEKPKQEEKVQKEENA